MPLIITPRQFTQRAELFQQLAQLTSAGIPIVRALEQIKRSPPARSFREPLQRLLDELAKGATLAESLQSLDWLPAFDLALIGAGEQSGRLDICYRLLADYYNDRARVIKQVISQLIYPVGLIHLAAIIFIIVLPYAASQFNASLTLLIVKAALILSPLYGAVALLIYATQSKHGENGAPGSKLACAGSPPGHGPALSRPVPACRGARITHQRRVNIFESWDLAATASGSPALRRAVAAWKPRWSPAKCRPKPCAVARCSRKPLPIFMPAARSAANWMNRSAI